MKKLLSAAILMMILINCTGCATLIGGIIGYQSGEAAAGAAIGAAIDIAGAIASHEHNKEEEKKKKEQEQEREREKEESVNIYSEEGYIRIGSISAQGRNYPRSLQRRFENIDWEFNEDEAQSIRDDDISKQVFECKTADGKEFTLELLKEEDQDLLIFIKPTESNRELQSMVTSQVGVWIRDIAGL